MQRYLNKQRHCGGKEKFRLMLTNKFNVLFSNVCNAQLAVLLGACSGTTCEWVHFSNCVVEYIIDL